MKIGLRMPSLKRRIAARTSWKRIVRHSMGLKMPQGLGLISNPKKAFYNRIYNKTSFSIDSFLKSNKNTTVNSAKINSSFWLNAIIFTLLAFIFFPFAIIFLIYKLYKIKKSKNQFLENNYENDQNEKFSIVSHSNSLIGQFEIPEPTRSLLWITDEDTSKISSSLGIKITFNLSKANVNIDDGHNFYAEPSLIWTKLPIEPNNELETKKMYYPSYSALSPIHRFQYLKWLTDIKQSTNLSYVFLYYYGLERQLLVGNYDLAVDEILELIKYHDEGTFKSYARNALILGSGYRKRPDIIEKAPFVLDEVSPVSLYLQRMAGRSISAENVISVMNRVGFSNKRYLNKYPELFKKELQQELDNYQTKNGDILQSIDLASLPKEGWGSMANTSIPDNIRTIRVPYILDSNKFKIILKEILRKTHFKIKLLKSRSDTKQISH